MSYNSKQLKVQSSAKKLPKPKDVDYISKMGYRDDSPFRDNSYNDIYTPNGIIDMSQTGIPLFANGQYLPPYSGTYDMGTENVREIPVAKKGGQKGLRKFTSKNIQTSLNDIMQRNTTLFGPSGKKRYKPDLNYKYGGWLDTYQTKGQVNPVQDSVRHQAIRSLQYEKGDPNNSNTGGGFDKNTKKAVGMSDWGYHESQSVPANPMFKSPTSLKQATDMWMQEVDPRTSPYFDKALTKSQANDFLFSTGRDIRPYIVDQIYKSQGKSGLPDRPKYNVDSKLPGYTQLKPEIDAMWAANKSAWDKLSYDDQQAMMGRSRQSYGQAIERGKGSINENLEAYNEVWKGRIPNLNSANYNQPVWWEQNNKKQYGGNSNNWLDSYQTGKEVTSEADYNKRLLLPNKSKEELAAQNAWVLKKNSSNKVVPYSWSPSGPYGPVKDVTSATPTYKGIDVSEQAIEQSKLRKEEKDRQARKDKITYDQSVGEHGKILGTLSYAAKKGDDWANSTEPGGGYETAGKALEFAAMSAMPLFEGVGLLKKPITTAAKWAFNNAAKSVATNTAKSIVKPVTKTVAKSINKPYKGFGEGLFNDQRLLTQEEMLAQEQAFYESQNYAVNEGKQTLNKILTQPLLPKVGSNSILQSQGFYNNFANQFNINNLLRESSKMSAPFSLRDSYTGFKDIYDTEGNVPKSKYFAPIVDAAFAVFPFTKIKGSSISNLIERPVTKLFENKNSIIPAVNYFVAKMAGKKAKGAVKDFTKNEVETLLENDNKNVIQKKYGGNNQKSIKKAVNYNRSSKFVNSQDSNWLNKYQ